MYANLQFLIARSTTCVRITGMLYMRAGGGVKRVIRFLGLGHNNPGEGAIMLERQRGVNEFPGIRAQTGQARHHCNPRWFYLDKARFARSDTINTFTALSPLFQPGQDWSQFCRNLRLCRTLAFQGCRHRLWNAGISTGSRLGSRFRTHLLDVSAVSGEKETRARRTGALTRVRQLLSNLCCRLACSPAFMLRQF